MGAAVYERAWVGVVQFPGREPFRVGTVMAPIRYTHREVEVLVLKLVRDIMPIDAVLPDLINIIPGVLVLIP